MKRINQYIQEKLIVNNTIQDFSKLTDDENEIISKLMYFFSLTELTYNYLSKICANIKHPEKILNADWVNLTNVLVGGVFYPSHEESKIMLKEFSDNEINWIENIFKTDWEDLMKDEQYIYKPNITKETILEKSKKYRNGMLNGIMKAYVDYFN